MCLDIEPEDLKPAEDQMDLAKYARQQLADYYGTAAHFYPGAIGDLTQLSNMSDEELLREARRNGLL